MGKDDYFPIQSDGVTKQRTHTDFCICFLFVGVVALMGGLAVIGFFEGDPRRLTHGRDYHGRLCGIDEGVEAQPFLYYCGLEEWSGSYPKRLNYKSTSCIAKCPNDTQSLIPCVMPAFVNLTMLPGGTESNVTYDSSLNVEVTQSVAYQHSYPTEEYMGRYCVPTWSSSNTLYSEVINGPLKEVAQFNSAIGSFMHAWPVILGASILAILLGMAYLYVLKYYAGLLLYISLWLGTLLTFLFGLFFLYGLFPDPFDDMGWYQQMSPVFVMCYGHEARFISALIGMILLLIGTCMLFATLNENIDESIGIITATVDCILGSGSGLAFVIQPIVQALTVTFLVCVLFYGFLLVSSVTEIDRNLIAMNGEFVHQEDFAKTLMANVVRPWYWSLAMKFYIIGFLWLMVTFISMCQFVISYAVCDWYFVECETRDNPNASPLSEPLKKAIANKGKRVDGVRIRGVDKAQGTRSGYIEKGPHGKVLVVPIGEKGPDGRDFIRYDEKITYKKLPLCAMVDGFAACIYYHLGTVALAGLANALTAPLRGFSEILKTFMGNPGRSDQLSGFDDEERTPSGLVIAGLGLCSSFLDEVFGRFSKNMYVDIVLRSTNFADSSNDAYDFIADAGGAVALLHGSTGNYEIISVVVITAICSVTTHLVLTKVPIFAQPEAKLYVGDPAIMTLLAATLSCIIASAFMSLFNMAADSLLYAFAWSRKYHGDDLRKFCPTALLHIVGKEMEEAPALALQPHPRNKMTRFSHAAARYKDTVMATMSAGRGGSEERPLLAGLSTAWSSRR